MMWFRYSQILLSTRQFLLTNQLTHQFRSPSVRNPLVRKVRRSIKNFDEDQILTVPSKNPFRLLIRPTIFTFSFVGVSFISCAIWQYESQRNKLKKLKQRWKLTERSGELTSQIKNILRDIPESKRFVGTIIGLNLIVFLLWRKKSFEPFLLKYFTSSPFKSNLSSMILSTFSHYNGFHFLCNMYVLWSFSDPIIRTLGKQQFTAVYLSGGIISTLFSYVFKVLTRTPNISLGASGSIMSIIGCICTQYPDARLSIIFLPFFTFSAKSGLIALVAFDLFGTIMRWRYLDHSAHLGGVLFGIFYVKYGYKILWEKLKPIVEYWHQLREKMK